MKNTENYKFNLPEGTDFYSVEHYNDNFKAIDEKLKEFKDGTQAVGDAEKLGGETADEWQDKLNAIQTTSSGTLSQAGWYRVAEYPLRNGNNGNSCDLSIKTKTSGSSNCSHKVRISRTDSSVKIKAIDTLGTDIISKIRLTYDSSKSYIELYYSVSASNPLFVAIDNPKDYSNAWKAITPTLTSETDGATIITTYDIPSNASPATDLDIADAINSINLGELYISESELDTLKTTYNIPNYWSYIATIRPQSSDSGYLFGGISFTVIGMEYYGNGHQLAFGYNSLKYRRVSGGIWGEWETHATTADIEHYAYPHIGTVGSDEDLSTALQNLHDSVGNGEYYTRRIALGYNHNLFGGGVRIIRGFRQAELYGYQIVETWGNDTMAIRSIQSGTWSDWDPFVKLSKLTRELANYLHKTGGDITGNIRQLLGNADASYRIKNNARDIEIYVDANGLLRFMDNTNSAPIFTSTVDGTNSFKGTASGNLPLDGNGTVTGTTTFQKSGYDPVYVNNAGGGDAFIAFKSSGSSKGFLGVSSGGVPMFKNSNATANYELLHKGNSAPTVVSTSAPSDTSAVWVVPSS